MRITNGMMASNYLSNVQNNLVKVDDLTTKMTTQKQINKVSQDPYKAIKIMNLKNDITTNGTYNSNCEEVIGWLNTVDESVGNVGDLASEMKLLLGSISGSTSVSDLDSIGADLNGKLEQIGNALNEKFVGDSVFSGSATDEKPILITKNAKGTVTLSINPNVNTDKLKADISNGIQYDYNMSIEKVLGVDGLNTLNSITTMFEDVTTLDIDKVIDGVKGMDSFLKHTISIRSIVGTQVNAVESIKTSNDESLLNLKGAYSTLQDVDAVTTIIELNTANAVYQSSLQVGAKILQPTLLDYLR